MKDNARKRLIASRIFAVVAVFFVFSAGWLLGTQTERSRTALDLSKFWRVYSLISAKFPGTIDKDKAVDGAIHGLVESLSDPYSAYLDQKEYKQLTEDLNGEFEGIGAVLTKEGDKIIVVEPIADSPAIKAGLKQNDQIIAVDGTEVVDQTLEQVVTKIRGPKGSEVVLTVLRGTKAQKITITRDTIEIVTVRYEKQGDVGIIRITQFGSDTVSGVKDAITKLEALGASKYLIDLRGNPGGFLNVAVGVAGLFLPPDTTVVKQVYQGGASDELKTVTPPVLPNNPLYVYIDGGSASASEILAGALRDNDRATLIGQKSYGKGSVQDILSLRGSTGLKITIAEWLTPNGDHINKVGINPDHQIIDGTQLAELNAAIKYIDSR
ncbi:MAG: S41 family peptidase [Patescibacteria group bacterium]